MEKKTRIRLIMGLMVLFLFSGCVQQKNSEYKLNILTEYCIDKGFDRYKDSNSIFYGDCIDDSKYKAKAIDGLEFKEWHYVKYGCGNINASSDCQGSLIR